MFSIGVMIVSDKGSRGEREDGCGIVIEEMLAGIGEIKHYCIVPDELPEIEEKLLHMCDELKLNLVLTSGGTGFSERDVTPEATTAVIQKMAPGITGAILMAGLQKTPRAMLSRAVAGIRGKTLIINLPGSPKGVRESLEAVADSLEHGLEILTGQTVECGQN